ncbi:hypothetical protein Tco_1081644 [Tanacetum coccineum]|uniref:Uncharacterized protein n=1 Tax=Tanacetum coccineum TaxID=301880 RepID=A0ABQ5HYA5_9ASTR
MIKGEYGGRRRKDEEGMRMGKRIGRGVEGETRRRRNTRVSVNKRGEKGGRREEERMEEKGVVRRWGERVEGENRHTMIATLNS